MILANALALLLTIPAKAESKCYRIPCGPTQLCAPVEVPCYFISGAPKSTEAAKVEWHTTDGRPCNHPSCMESPKTVEWIGQMPYWGKDNTEGWDILGKIDVEIGLRSDGLVIWRRKDSRREGR